MKKIKEYFDAIISKTDIFMLNADLEDVKHKLGSKKSKIHKIIIYLKISDFMSIFLEMNIIIKTLKSI